MTTSGSMPFSFASASIVCCKGFDILNFRLSARGWQLELDFQIRPGDDPERHPMGTPTVAVDQHVVALQPGEAALEEPLAVHLLPHHDLGATPGKPPVILDAPERPIQSRRRDLQGVRARYDLLDVENRAQIAPDMGAIVDADALAGVAGRPRPVDEHPEHHALAFTTVLHVENLQAVARCHTGRRLPDLLENVRAAHLSSTLTYSARHLPTYVVSSFSR